MIPGQKASPIWPRVVDVWERIDQEEGVHDSGRTVEWLIISGAEALTELRSRRSALADHLIREHGPDSEIAVHLRHGHAPILYVGGERHDRSLFRVEVIDGRRFDERRVILRPLSSAYPDLVLGTITTADLPCSVSVRLGALARLPLLDGPASGFPANSSPTGGWPTE